MKVEVELEELSKDQIIKLIELGVFGKKKKQQTEIDNLVEVPNNETKPKVGQDKPKKPQKKLFRRRTKYDFEAGIDNAVNVLEKRGKPMPITFLMKEVGIPPHGNNYTTFKEMVVRGKKLKAQRVGSKLYIHNRGWDIAKPKKVKKTKEEKRKPKKATKQTAYRLFMAKQIKKYGKLGYNQHDGFRMATVDWSRLKHKQDKKPEWESFKVVKEEFHEIVRNVLYNLMQGGDPLDYQSVQYTLGLVNLKNYKEFLREAVTKSKMVKNYFGENSNRNFVTDNRKLYYK